MNIFFAPTMHAFKGLLFIDYLSNTKVKQSAITFDFPVKNEQGVS